MIASAASRPASSRPSTPSSERATPSAQPASLAAAPPRRAASGPQGPSSQRAQPQPAWPPLRRLALGAPGTQGSKNPLLEPLRTQLDLLGAQAYALGQMSVTWDISRVIELAHLLWSHNPKPADAMRRYGDALCSIEMYDEAEEAWKKALDLPRHAAHPSMREPPPGSRARALRLMHEADALSRSAPEALHRRIELLAEARAVHPTLFPVLVRLARALVASGQLERAVEPLRAAAAGRPRHEGTHMALSELLFDLNDLAGAQQACTEGLQRCGLSSPLLLRRACIAAMAGQPIAAVADCERALRLRYTQEGQAVRAWLVTLPEVRAQLSGVPKAVRERLEAEEFLRSRAPAPAGRAAPSCRPRSL